MNTCYFASRTNISINICNLISFFAKKLVTFITTYFNTIDAIIIEPFNIAAHFTGELLT